MSGSFIWVRSEIFKESLCSGAPWSQYTELCKQSWTGRWSRQGVIWRTSFWQQRWFKAVAATFFFLPADTFTFPHPSVPPWQRQEHLYSCVENGSRNCSSCKLPWLGALPQALIYTCKQLQGRKCYGHDLINKAQGHTGYSHGCNHSMALQTTGQEGPVSTLPASFSLYDRAVSKSPTNNHPWCVFNTQNCTQELSKRVLVESDQNYPNQKC